MLAESGRHRQSAACIGDAQRLLASVIEWAGDCEQEDDGVRAIGEEAIKLRNAAEVANELVQADLASSSPEKVNQERSVQQAMAFTAPGERRRHRRVQPDSPASPAKRGMRATQSGGNLTLPSLRESCETHERINGADGDGTPSKTQNQGQRDRTSASVPAKTQRGGFSKSPKQQQPTNIFNEFLNDMESVKEQRRRNFSNAYEDDVRRRLNQNHKQSRLALLLSTDDGLKDKRYSSTGHQIFMKSMMKENRSRSDPSLLQEAKKSKKSPEACQLRQLSRQLHVEKSAPPPPPPPRKALHEDIGAGLGAALKRSLSCRSGV
eukprot:TRINITY_DN41362_c0_g1_i1.p1 TRINITY_DN41362_c0_g1~~TRINITY_DN41362_c0_g1_i1.p1  ORF type:complete len:348 (+),score=73.08 TRINITY_DN41362_c0_g1_i1:82-1044(+)